MRSVWKWALIFLLLALCIGIGIRFDVECVTYFFTARFAHYDITKVYGQNWDLGPYFYGPVTLPFLLPFHSVGYPFFKTVSMVVDSLCFLATWWVMHQLFPSLRSQKNVLGWLLLWILAINPFHHHFQSHNVQVLLAGILFVAEYLAVQSSGRSRFAGGFLCAVAAMSKLYPMLLAAYYLTARPKEVRSGVIAGGIFSIVFPLLVFGPTDGIFLFREFIEGLFGYEAAGHGANSLAKTSEILCLPSLVARLMPEGTWLHAYEGVIGKFLFLSIAGAFLFFGWKTRKSEKINPSWTWAIGAGLMVFLYPPSRAHYFMFYLPAFAILNEIYYSSESSIKTRYTVLVGMILPVIFMALTVDFVVGKYRNNEYDFANVPTYGMIILLLTAWAYTYKKVATLRETR
jgi:hypothetical protein